MNRYIIEYSGKRVPRFFEGPVFKITVPVPEVVNEVVPEVVNEVVNGKLSALLNTIMANEGKRVPEYMKSTGLTYGTIQRYIRQLKEAGLIEFKGNAPKSGGYYLKQRNK